MLYRSHFPRCALHIIAVAALVLACQPVEDEDSMPPHVVGGSDIERGRYLVTIGGCNDCHTEGFLQSEGNVPEDRWLLGWAVGWRGPWGTTYAPNLRLAVDRMSEDEWVTMLRTRTALPPMPWMNINQMAESDARAVYRYISSLEPLGEPTPAALPPDQEPTTPYFALTPVMPEQ